MFSEFRAKDRESRKKEERDRGMNAPDPQTAIPVAKARLDSK